MEGRLSYPEYLEWVAYYSKKDKRVEKLEYYLARLTHFYYLKNTGDKKRNLQSFIIGHEDEGKQKPITEMTHEERRRQGANVFKQLSAIKQDIEQKRKLKKRRERK